MMRSGIREIVRELRLHGEVAEYVAARRGQIGLLASDVIDGVPAGFERLRLAPA